MDLEDRFEALTDEEKNAIRTLQRLAKRWPRSLWLFSASGSLQVMKCGSDGERVYLDTDPGRHWSIRGEEKEAGPGCGVDQRYIVATIDIPNDGGDW